jgi:uncharacterized protein YkwD
MVFPQNEKKIFNLINKYRHSHGLQQLLYDAFVADVARGHSQDMAAGLAKFGHNGFDKRVAKLSDISFKEISENIATYKGEPINEEIVVQFWLKSKNHRKIIKGEYQSTGIGIARKPNESVYYITQLFLKLE